MGRKVEKVCWGVTCVSRHRFEDYTYTKFEGKDWLAMACQAEDYDGNVTQLLPILCTTKKLAQKLADKNDHVIKLRMTLEEA